MSERNYRDMQFRMSNEVSALLEERHILEKDVKEIVRHAESTGEKLYKEDVKLFLAKLVMKRPRSGRFAKLMPKREFTCYVEYSISDDGYQIHSAYSHNAVIETE